MKSLIIGVCRIRYTGQGCGGMKGAAFTCNMKSAASLATVYLRIG